MTELTTELPRLEQIIAKPFEKEHELAEMKTKLANLERETTLKIQEKQMQQNEPQQKAMEEVSEEMTLFACTCCKGWKLP